MVKLKHRRFSAHARSVYARVSANLDRYYGHSLTEVHILRLLSSLIGDDINRPSGRWWARLVTGETRTVNERYVTVTFQMIDGRFELQLDPLGQIDKKHQPPILAWFAQSGKVAPEWAKFAEDERSLVIKKWEGDLKPEKFKDGDRIPAVQEFWEYSYSHLDKIVDGDFIHAQRMCAKEGLEPNMISAQDVFEARRKVLKRFGALLPANTAVAVEGAAKFDWYQRYFQARNLLRKKLRLSGKQANELDRLVQSNLCVGAQKPKAKHMTNGQRRDLKYIDKTVEALPEKMSEREQAIKAAVERRRARRLRA